MPLQQQPKAGDIVKDKFGTDKVITQKELDDMKRKQQGQISKSIAGTVDGVSGGKEKDKTKPVPVAPGTITGPEIGIKGTTGVGSKGDIGVVGGAGTKGEVGSVSQGSTTQSQVQSIPNTNQNAIVPFMPPIIAIVQLPSGKYRPMIPKRDNHIIYKGQTSREF